jgi:hypothetical protein
MPYAQCGSLFEAGSREELQCPSAKSLLGLPTGGFACGFILSPAISPYTKKPKPPQGIGPHGDKCPVLKA